MSLDQNFVSGKALYIFPLPPDTLRTNRRFGQHWGSDHRVKVDYRIACLAKAREQHTGEVFLECHMIVIAYLGTRQRCDPSDLGSWCKVPIDTMVTACILSGDSAAHIHSFTAVVKRDPKNPRLEIRLRQGKNAAKDRR